MGDRVLIQVVNGKEFSPIAYGHWSGSYTPEILSRLRKRMKDRGGDVPYTFARLIQEMIGNDDSALSFGAWNADKVLTKDDSHGDAGCVIIDLAKGWHIRCEGGYLQPTPDGESCLARHD